LIQQVRAFSDAIRYPLDFSSFQPYLFIKVGCHPTALTNWYGWGGRIVPVSFFYFHQII